MTKLRSVVAGCALPLCAAVAVAGVQVASAASGSSRAGTTRRTIDTRAGGHPAPWLTANFKLFNRGPAGRDAAAASSEPYPIPSAVVNAYGLDLADTQFVSTSSADVWAIPGATGACITVQPAIGGSVGPASIHCEGQAAMEAYGLSAGSQWSGSATQGEVVAALVPNGNPAVTVNEPRNAQVSVGTTDNIAIVASKIGTIKIAYRAPSGSARYMLAKFKTATVHEGAQTSSHSREVQNGATRRG